MKTERKCVCVADCSRNPYRVDECANVDCQWCGGSGTLKICISHEKPPIPTTVFDYSAWVDGFEETCPVGCGSTKEQAVEALLSELGDLQPEVQA